tara:strand:- start:5825 stop:6115 length:291 start_codon:yes stop_codon:yes gene_type:complete
MKTLLFLLTEVMNPFTVTQAHVLPVLGCGTSCRVETEQQSLPEVMDDGWLRSRSRSDSKPGFTTAIGRQRNAEINPHPAEQVHRSLTSGCLLTALG